MAAKRRKRHKKNDTTRVPEFRGSRGQRIASLGSVQKQQAAGLPPLEPLLDDLLFAETLHKFVNEKVMPQRRDLEGGWERDEALAEKTFFDLTQGLVDLGLQRAFLPEEIGGMGLTSAVTACMVAEELSRGDIGLYNNMIIVP